MSLDPAAACLRCWEHEDCVDHPELGLACASGAVTLVGVHEHNEIAMETFERVPLNIVFPGDGKVDPSVYGHGYGDFGGDYGDNLGNGSGVGRAVGSPEAYATLEPQATARTVVSHFMSTLPALMAR